MEVHWVTPRLAVSGHQPLSAANSLANAGIRAVLNLTERPDPKWTFISHQDPTPDDGQPKPASWFKDGINFTLTAMKHGPVLVHCEAGINRGPSMAYAILRALGHSSVEAKATVLKKVPGANLRYQADADKLFS